MEDFKKLISNKEGIEFIVHIYDDDKIFTERITAWKTPG